MTPLTGILTEQRRAGWTAGTAGQAKAGRGIPGAAGRAQKGSEL